MGRRVKIAVPRRTLILVALPTISFIVPLPVATATADSIFLLFLFGSRYAAILIPILIAVTTLFTHYTLSFVIYAALGRKKLKKECIIKSAKISILIALLLFVLTISIAIPAIIKMLQEQFIYYLVPKRAVLTMLLYYIASLGVIAGGDTYIFVQSFKNMFAGKSTYKIMLSYAIMLLSLIAFSILSFIPSVLKVLSLPLVFLYYYLPFIACRIAETSRES